MPTTTDKFQSSDEERHPTENIVPITAQDSHEKSNKEQQAAWLDEWSGFEGTWHYVVGREFTYTLVASGGNYEMTEDQGQKGTLKKEGEWYTGKLENKGQNFGLIRLQRRGSTVVSQFRKVQQDDWGAEVIARKKAYEEGTRIRFLPKRDAAGDILLASQQDNKWRIVSRNGVAYRKSKEMNDRDSIAALFDQVVDGSDEGDWIRVELQEDEHEIEVTNSPRHSILSSWSTVTTQNENSLAQISRINNDALAGVDITATLRKSEKLFDAIMDPSSQETKNLLRDLFETPMKAITDKTVSAVKNIDLDDIDKAKNQIEITREVLNLAHEVRESCIESVYETLSKQIAQFEDGVDAWNRKVKETVVQTLDLYKEKIDREIEIRQTMMEQRKCEHQMMLEERRAEVEQQTDATKKKSEAKAAKELQELEVQKKREAQEAEKEQRKLEQAAKKAQQDLEKEMKKIEADNEKATKEMQRAQQQALNELERQEKKGKLDADERARVMQEFQVEMDRYQKEYNLAEFAMKAAIAKGSFCTINHTAPKIKWAAPASVVPGHVEWRARG